MPPLEDLSLDTDTAAPDSAAPAERSAPAGDKPAEAPAAGDAAPAGDKPAAGSRTAPAKAAADQGDLDFEDEPSGDAKPQASWPDDWREKLAGTDPKFLAELKRFTSFEKYAASTKALRQKLSSGEYKRAKLDDNASDEEKAAWRAENGIPEKPEDYVIPEVKGHEWTDGDKPIVSAFLTAMHKAGAPQVQAKAALEWYAGLQQQQAEARADHDRMAMEAREDALRAEWGPADFRPHVNLAQQVFKDPEFFSDGLRAALATARSADGTRIIHHPDFTRFLAEQGLQRRGTAGLISGEQGARMGGRIDEIKKIMATDLERYYADGLDKELLELNDKMESGRSR